MLVGRYSQTKGISVYQFDKGQLTFLKDSCDVINPSYLCSLNDKVYAITETTSDPSEFEDGITVYQKDNSNDIQLLWSHFSGNLGSCYVTLDPSQRIVLMANYKDGSISASLIDNPDVYKENLTKVSHQNSSTKQNMQSHVHYLCFTPDEKYLCAVDLGLDSIIEYSLSLKNYNIVLEKVFETNMPVGTGPRHMCFAQNGTYAYVCGELNSTVTVLKYLGESGFQIVQTIASTSKASNTPNYPSAIKLSEDGCYLYVANRGEDSISVFNVNQEEGFISLIQEIDCGGKFPRDFCFDITGEYIVVANQNSHNLGIFKRDMNRGLLNQIDTISDVESPTCVVFYEK
jgi:6-phosphogluconolactonase